MPDDNSPLDTDVAKPWYRSTTLQGLVVMLITIALQYAKVSVPGLDGDVATGVDAFFTLSGAVMVAIGRIKARKIITATPSTASKLNG